MLNQINLEKIPDDTLLLIIKKCNIASICSLCLVNKSFYNLLCNNRKVLIEDIFSIINTGVDKMLQQRKFTSFFYLNNYNKDCISLPICSICFKSMIHILDWHIFLCNCPKLLNNIFNPIILNNIMNKTYIFYAHKECLVSFRTRNVVYVCCPICTRLRISFVIHPWSL